MNDMAEVLEKITRAASPHPLAPSPSEGRGGTREGNVIDFSASIPPLPSEGEGARGWGLVSPVDGSSLGEITFADADAVNGIVQKAKAAFPAWAGTPVKERAQIFFRFKALVERDLGRLAESVHRENGKTVAEAAAGIQRGLEVVEYATALPALLAGETLEVSRGVDCSVRRYPLGVVAGITPFNFPAMVPMWMFPLAIAAGNTFLLKPSEQTPLTPLLLGELLIEAGLPDGVFNVVQGDRATVEAILDHPDVQAGAFVGSTPVAKAVYQRGTAAGKRMLTLGGAKNHVVALPDADIASAARNIAASVTGCAGQRCMAASVLITVGKCDALMNALTEEMAKARPGVEMGAIISRKAQERITGYIDRAERGGAKLLLDGRGVTVPGKENGNYIGPTIIDGVAPGSESACDEIFGPVISILHVDTLDEALAIENTSPYGNAASIYTSSGPAARYFEQNARAGMIGVNIGVPVPRDPFGFGGWNDSKFGAGDITGLEGVLFWTKAKKTTTKWADAGPRTWMS